MILVRNRPLQLNGSKTLWIGLCLSVLLSGCGIFGPIIPKKAPEEPVEQQEQPKEPEEPEVPVEEPEKEKAFQVVLMLPLQLNRIDQDPPAIEDVKRVLIPLDFYQGFRMGIETVAAKGHNFNVTVLDSRDNEDYARALGTSDEARSADLIVGPIFPKEISAFAQGMGKSNVLLVSPLAASTPSEFNISNLVSLVAPISGHAHGLAEYLQTQYKTGDKIFIFSNQDADSHKFLLPLKRFLQKAGIAFSEATEMEQLESECTLSGKNMIVMGTTNRFSISSALHELSELKAFGYSIDLYGHPNWAKMNLDPQLLTSLNTRITTSSYVNPGDRATRDFQQAYIQAYKVDPTEYAYKGYDTGYFFGYMLAQYGEENMNALEEETYKGLQTNYVFEQDPSWGFVNTFIRILRFDGYAFRPEDR